MRKSKEELFDFVVAIESGSESVCYFAVREGIDSISVSVYKTDHFKNPVPEFCGTYRNVSLNIPDLVDEIGIRKYFEATLANKVFSDSITTYQISHVITREYVRCNQKS